MNKTLAKTKPLVTKKVPWAKDKLRKLGVRKSIKFVADESRMRAVRKQVSVTADEMGAVLKVNVVGKRYTITRIQ